MPRFFAYTSLQSPGLHLWREGTNVKLSLHPVTRTTGPGWVEFRCRLTANPREPVRFMLFSFQGNGSPGAFENNDHQRRLPRLESGALPEAVWFAQGSSRVVLQDPREAARATTRVHLISQRRFRPAQMYLWDPATGLDRRVDQSGLDDLGPYFDLTLDEHETSYFNFKFIGQRDGAFTEFEPDIANRWWVAGDGPEIWVHSSTATIAHSVPTTRRLTINYRQQFSAPAVMRLWAENGDYETDIQGIAGDGWTAYSADLYAHLPYGCLFHNPSLPKPEQWEHPDAKRDSIVIETDTERWTLEGDDTLFTTPPVQNKQLNLAIANTALSQLTEPIFAHVWINRARAPLAASVPVDALGRVSLAVYPDVLTSVRFHDSQGRWESIPRHTVRAASDEPPTTRYVVLERPGLLAAPPPADLVADPPFWIQRPGAYADGDQLRFVLHAPSASQVDLIGEWTGWLDRPVPMRLTRDGSYWWASVAIAQLLADMDPDGDDYHGVRYQFLFDQQTRWQDPAAGWVEQSEAESFSRLVRHDRYQWHDHQWRRPGWESLIIYQLHPSRFTDRFQDDPPLRRIAREVADEDGYFRELGVTAIQLMPVNEVGSTNSWGYDPSYFYAIENAYCGENGPDELKHLVDTCHQHGLAVVLDVVFNHAGGDDNILWHVARESFFDGDTRWGAMINFDQPQCRHFFARNLVYLANEFHIDGFRLDHTATIVHSASWDAWSSFVRELGSGGGWDFLHALRHAVETQVGGNCILMAEHLPNEWSLTNLGGPMDSQWSDDFHDRLIDACRRLYVMERLAAAMQLSQTACDNWYKVVNYPESHDEVGNVRDRVAYVAGFGQGWRMSKVAAAATLMSRGIPLLFMGAESGEDRLFGVGTNMPNNVTEYMANEDRSRIRAWWRELSWLRRDPGIQGPAPLNVRLATDQLLAFTRGMGDDFFVLLNFGGWAGSSRLADLNLPWGEYRELWNSTWPAFAIACENEDEHSNGGRDARLHRHHSLNVPDYGVVILQRV